MQRILIVEDEEAIANLINMMLGSKAQLPNIENLIFYSK